jgi:hypothetical protein
MDVIYENGWKMIGILMFNPKMLNFFIMKVENLEQLYSACQNAF